MTYVDLNCEGISIDDTVFADIVQKLQWSMNCKDKTRLGLSLTTTIDGCKFDRVALFRTAIKNLSGETFDFPAMRSLSIKESIGLLSIDPNAFIKSKHTLQELEVIEESLVSVAKIIEFVKSFQNLKRLKLEINGLVKIHRDYFDGNFSKLEELDLQNNDITLIEEHSFSKLNNLKRLRLGHNNLRMVTKNMFTFEPPANDLINEKLYIDLNHNHINSFALDPDAFLFAYRPVWLNLSSNLLSSLQQSVFGKFLFNDPRNVVDVSENPLVCDDSSRWILENRLYFSYKRGGKDFDVNTDYVPHVIDGGVRMSRRSPNDYSYYKIRGMICQNDRNIFETRLNY
ncbi:Leucine rich repeat containing protein 10-like protein [Dinothrombium tinctorium]|uniref:Leucine rich repeat containing protein 10-like protein n=1 Tax=Dinothrombium tinctorium TaxID=1965070 RepID=A0A3S4QLV3_9ACAR|nr:Leucine rich repeat containing protein 10-like protein [Dinothrombium tinctorium]RWS06487.1 Leucine rich repeat containing protein 10-like protein [Dinothrombium tinctorium]